MSKNATPLEILNEIKLRMGYDSKKTLSENKIDNLHSEKISEQSQQDFKDVQDVRNTSTETKSTNQPKRKFNFKIKPKTNLYGDVDDSKPMYITISELKGSNASDIKVSNNGKNYIKFVLNSGNKVIKAPDWKQSMGPNRWKWKDGSIDPSVDFSNYKDDIITLDKNLILYVKVSDVEYEYLFPAEYSCVTDGKKTINNDKTISYEKDGYKFYDNGRFSEISTGKKGTYSC